MKGRLNELMAYCRELGADYADLRMKDITKESIELEDGKVKAIDKNRSFGVGLRLFADGSMGFAAANDLENLKELADKAFAIAKASRTLQKERIELSAKKAECGEYRSPAEIDPFDVPLSEKLALLQDCAGTMAAVDGVKKTYCSMEFRKEEHIFCDTDGSYIKQNFIQSGAGISAMAVSGTEAQSRSYPASFGGNYARRGYEFIKSMGLLENARRIAEESVILLNAPDCPSGIFDLVIEPSQMILQIHESVGHPTELDRIFGSEAAYAGESFCKPEHLKQNFRYGSDKVSIVADATVPGALGTFGFDDEGVRATRTVLIEKGILKNYQTSRDTACKIGRESTGGALADGWQNLPIVRMTNINLLPGEYSLDELISGVKDGFLLSVNKSWSIDDKRINFQFACEAAYEIKDGKKTGKIFRNPIYSGITAEFWASCDGVGNEADYVLFGIPNCGKGQPGQVARPGHGSAHARFRKVKVGVNDVK
jgi:TldD protein